MAMTRASEQAEEDWLSTTVAQEARQAANSRDKTGRPRGLNTVMLPLMLPKLPHPIMARIWPEIIMAPIGPEKQFAGKPCSPIHVMFSCESLKLFQIEGERMFCSDRTAFQHRVGKLRAFKVE